MRSGGCWSIPSAIARSRVEPLAGLVAGLLLALASAAGARVEPRAQFASPLSPRNANYEIEARLDPELRRLEGRQVLTWRNLQVNPASELRFHLYWNAFRNSRSTWMLEDRIRGRNSLSKITEEDWGYLQVSSVTLLDGPGGSPADLTGGLRFVSPDDGNPDDRTVVVVPLPRPVAQGETVRVEMVWTARVPRTFARTGFRGDYYFIAHWFPKLGVWEEQGWNCHQFHAGTEFFSDYGVYDVSITLPGNFVIGATGLEIERVERPGDEVTHRYYQEDVHAFTWTASPDYLVLSDRFESPGLPPVDIRLLLQPEHRGQAERHFAATKATLEHYGRWYGPYPYGHLTVVDPAYGSGAGGMEYPTLFTAGTRLFNPFGGGSPEGVTIHEAGHQFWYGIVGNNEFEDAWLDEGLNTFSTSRVHQVAYGDRRLSHRFLTPAGTEVRGFLPLLLDGFVHRRSIFGNRIDRYRPHASSDDQSTPTWLYFPATGGNLSYSKTALWLGTLERYLGWETLQAILSTFYDRWQFGHPGPEDFIQVASEVSGTDLVWFFDQVYRSSEAFDYAVESVASEPAAVRGLVEAEDGLEYRAGDDEDDGDEGPEEGDARDRIYRTEVEVRRHGGGVFPVELLMVFEDGEQVRRHWRGEERWRLFVVERPSKLAYAEVDPDGVLLLDIDRGNNSRQLEAAADLPAAKWSSRWLVWLQDFLMTFAFLG